MSQRIKKYALLGESLKHTMSPPIHSELFKLKDREFEYEVIELEPEQLEQNRQRLGELNGYNITIPYKVEIIKFTDKLDKTAQRYNSVNCIDNKGGIKVGYNTDCGGFLRTIEAMGADLKGRSLLIGCGGVGRMMAIETALAGGELFIGVLKSDIMLAQKAKEEILQMKPDAAVEIVFTDSLPDMKFDLLMNACPVGMYPKIEGCPVEDRVIKNSEYVFDVVYNPRKTKLIQKAEAMGKTASGGMAMLVWQAVYAHEIWDGDVYSIKEVNEIIKKMELEVEKQFS